MEEYQIGEIARAKDGGLYRFKGGETTDRTNWEPVQEPEKPSAVGGFARSVGQGATFGFSDEALGALAGAGAGIKHAVTGTGPTFGEEYGSVVGSERAKQRAFAEDHPVANVVGEIAGGALPMLAGGALLGATKGAAAVAAPVAERSIAKGIGMGLLKGAGRGAVEGAGYGALAGAGTSEGGISERLRGAGRGAAAGAAVGTVLGGTLGAASPTGSAVMDKFGLRPQGAASPFSKYLGIESIEGRANNAATRAIGEEGLTTTDIRNTALRTPDKPLMLAESGMREGPLERALTDTKGVPAITRAKIAHGTEVRTMEAPTRLQADLERRTGVQRVPSTESATKIAEERAAQAKPLYDAAYAVGPVEDEEITKLLATPSGQKAVARAMKIAADERDPEFAQWAGGATNEDEFDVAARALVKSMGASPEQARGIMEAQRAAGRMPNLPQEVMAAGEAAPTQADITAGRAIPTVKMLDYVKQGLDAMLPQTKATAGGVKTKEYRAIVGLKDALLEKMDAKVPEYKAARDAFAGKSAELNAHNTAQELFDASSDFRDVAKEIAGMSASEKQAFRSSGVDALLYQVGEKGPSEVANWVDRTPNMREKVRLLFEKPQDADHFLGDLRAEQRMAEPPLPKHGAGGPSGTHYIPYPSPTGLAVYGMRNLLRAPSQSVTERTGNEVAQLLSAGLHGPQERQAALRRLEEFAKKRQRTGIGRVLTAGATTTAGLGAGR